MEEQTSEFENTPQPDIDLLNKRVTPVVQSRGSLGEADLAQLSNVGATMLGAGEAYYQGVRMQADQALKKAGLSPIQPFAADDNALTSSNAYATGQALYASPPSSQKHTMSKRSD